MKRIVKWKEGDPEDQLWVCLSCGAELNADCVGDALNEALDERDAALSREKVLREALTYIASHQLRKANGVQDNYLQPLAGVRCVRTARAALNASKKETGE